MIIEFGLRMISKNIKASGYLNLGLRQITAQPLPS